MKCYLVGFMGCGKSSIGRRIAERMEWPFVDMDELITETAGMTIPEIFAAEGEDAFRQRERAALEETFKLDQAIVATGGGCPCYFDNMERINAQGVSVHLRNNVDFFVDKLMNAKTERPLVKGKSEEELREYISSTLANRNPFYYKAHHIFHTRDYAKKKSAKIIAATLNATDEG